MRALFSMMTMITVAGCVPSITQAQRAPRADAESPARSERALVFVVTTGLEDLQTSTSAFRHARAAAERGQLREVVVLVYGRGIQAFDGDITARPPALAESIRAAMASGVRVLLCANAMERMGVLRERLDPVPTEVVPNAIATLVDYVTQDAAVVSY